MNRLEVVISQLVIRYRWWIIFATILMVLAAGSGVSVSNFNNDVRAFFCKENPQLQALKSFEDTYTKDESVFFAIVPKDGNIFTRKTLAAVKELTEASWKIPYSSRVDSISNFHYFRGEGDDLIVEGLFNDQDTEGLSDSEVERIKKVALSDPMLLNRLISPSGHVTGVSVNILLPGKSMNETSEVAACAREIAEDFRRKYPNIDIHLTGWIIMASTFDEVVVDELTTLFPVASLILFTIMGAALRSLIGTFSVLIIMGFSVLTAIGLAGWLGIPLNVISVNAPTIILTLAVADCIHILVTMFHLMRQGKSKQDALSESLRVNIQPVFITSATTAIAFLSMNFSDAPPFRDLGNIVAIGITAAFVYSVFFLPALMAVLPVQVKPVEMDKRHAFDGFAEFVVSRRKPLFWCILILIVGLTTGIPLIELSDNGAEYFDESYDFRKATDFVEENLTGCTKIEYSLGSGKAEGISSPEYLAKVEEFANWYRNQPNVIHVRTITDTMKQLNKNLHGDNEAYYRLPEQEELAAQYLLLYEMSLPSGHDLNNQISGDRSASRMTVVFRNGTSQLLIESDESARDWLTHNAPETMFTHGTSMDIMFANISKRNIDSMLGASFLALILISCILMLVLRSFKLGLVSLIPNMTPAFMAFGVWGMIEGRVGVALSVVAALTLGIVVDDTVHLISKYIRARREYGISSSDAIRYSFNTVGAALLKTTVILAAGFAVLIFSGFQPNSQLGHMTVMTMVLALILDFLFLPALLVKAEDKTINA